MTEHFKKKLAFLPEKSAKAPADSKTLAVLCKFLLFNIIINMFLKPANSDMENGLQQNSKMSPEKKT